MSAVAHESRRAFGDLRPAGPLPLRGHARSRPTRREDRARLVHRADRLRGGRPGLLAEGAGTAAKANDLLLLLPSAYLAFLLTTTLAIIGSGGGRELLPRDQAVAFPLSPRHRPPRRAAARPAERRLDHPGLVADGGHRVRHPPAHAGSRPDSHRAVAGRLDGHRAGVAWCVELVRRGRHGVAFIRASGSSWRWRPSRRWSRPDSLATCSTVRPASRSPRVIALSRWRGLADLGDRHRSRSSRSPLGPIAAGRSRRALRRPSDPARGGQGGGADRSSRCRCRAPTWPALVRTDRASVLALRCRCAAASLVLALLPGLVAAGGQLVLGHDADPARAGGGRWRAAVRHQRLVPRRRRRAVARHLPVDPQLAFVGRMQVLLEILMIATTLTLLVAGLRAGGLPTSARASGACLPRSSSSPCRSSRARCSGRYGGRSRWISGRPAARRPRRSRCWPTPAGWPSRRR